MGALAYRQIAYEHAQVPAQIKGAAKARWDQLQKALKQFDALRPVPPAPVLTATDVGPVSPPTSIPGERKQKAIEPGFPSVLDPSDARIEASPAAPRSTGRRLALARWLSRPDNPLSTRVIVNRIWQYHFGRGLAGTPSDFGRLGEPPSHPELLDWLAAEFVGTGLASQAAAPADLNLGRLPPGRTTQPQRPGRGRASRSGKSVALEANGAAARCRGNSRRHARRQWRARNIDRWPERPDRREPRRTVDTRIIRNTRDALLDAFDAPDGNATTPRRNTTTTAPQALFLINGEWALARAEDLANRLERLEPARSINRPDRDGLSPGIRAPPEPDEVATEPVRSSPGRPRPREQPHRHATSRPTMPHSSISAMCCFNSNEFLYVD